MIVKKCDVPGCATEAHEQYPEGWKWYTLELSAQIKISRRMDICPDCLKKGTVEMVYVLDRNEATDKKGKP